MRYHTMLAVPACNTEKMTLAFQRINVGPTPTSSMTYKIMNKKLDVVSTHKVTFKNDDPVKVTVPLLKGEDTYVYMDCRFFKVGVEGVKHYGFTASESDPFIMFNNGDRKDITVCGSHIINSGCYVG